MPFSEAAINDLRNEFGTIGGKYEALMEVYIMRSYENVRAKEYATHGFCRRLKTLNRCIQNVFEIYPSDRVNLLSMDELTDVAINIQAFVVNVFGCIDNLAWIWVLEKGITRENGQALANREIGLRHNNQTVWGSLSTDFRNYLDELNEWYEILSDFRHAVAHRVPLYVAPSEIIEADIDAYNELEYQMTIAIQQHDFVEYQRLTGEQKALGQNSIWMRHSFEENNVRVAFHAQLLADFNTVDRIARRMLMELNY